MKNILRILVIIFSPSLFLFLGFISNDLETDALGAEVKVSEKSEEKSSTQFGPTMAVTSFSKEDGFKLSDKALLKLEIKFEKLNGTQSWTIPSEALVRIKQSTGVYRRLDGWITFVLVKVTQNSADKITITSEDLEAGDEVAITGTQFLRMTDADLNSDTVDNCSH